LLGRIFAARVTKPPEHRTTTRPHTTMALALDTICMRTALFIVLSV